MTVPSRAYTEVELIEILRDLRDYPTIWCASMFIEVQITRRIYKQSETHLGETVMEALQRATIHVLQDHLSAGIWGNFREDLHRPVLEWCEAQLVQHEK